MGPTQPSQQPGLTRPGRRGESRSLPQVLYSTTMEKEDTNQENQPETVPFTTPPANRRAWCRTGPSDCRARCGAEWHDFRTNCALRGLIASPPGLPGVDLPEAGLSGVELGFGNGMDWEGGDWWVWLCGSGSDIDLGLAGLGCGCGDMKWFAFFPWPCAHLLSLARAEIWGLGSQVVLCLWRRVAHDAIGMEGSGLDCMFAGQCRSGLRACAVGGGLSCAGLPLGSQGSCNSAGHLARHVNNHCTTTLQPPAPQRVSRFYFVFS